MYCTKVPPLLTDVEQVLHRLHSYSDSFSDVETPDALSLYDRAKEAKTRNGAEEILDPAELIQAQAELARAQAELSRSLPGDELIEAQAELTRAQAELIQTKAKKMGAVMEGSKAEGQNENESEKNKAKVQGDLGKQKKRRRRGPRPSFWRKVCLFFGCCFGFQFSRYG